MRCWVRCAAGLLLGSTACAAGATGATSTTFASVGEGGNEDGASSSGSAGTDDTGVADDAASTSDAATSTGFGDDDTTQGDETSGSDTGLADPCAGELETFAADPNWTSIGLPDGGNAYGFLMGGTHAGGDPGEIGGTFQRSGNRSVFADAIGPTVAGSCIAAHGRLIVPRVDNGFNSYIQFGHFSLAGGSGVGFAIAENGDDSVRVFMFAGGTDELAFVLDQPGVAREWSYELDPESAMMTLTLEGYGSLSRPVTPDDAASLVGLDEFGIHHEPHDNAGESQGQLEIYLDEITYTR